MQYYRRRHMAGGAFFFAVVAYDRKPILCTDKARGILRDAITECRRDYPFVIEAFVLLPDHIHCIWRLPLGDSDYSIRWNMIKRFFTREWIKHGGPEGVVSASRARHGHRGVWQRRFWEHTIRDEVDYHHHLNYIHYNPVKHGYAACPHAWPYSSFDRWARRGFHAPHWHCQCRLPDVEPTDFDDISNCE